MRLASWLLYHYGCGMLAEGTDCFILVQNFLSFESDGWFWGCGVSYKLMCQLFHRSLVRIEDSNARFPFSLYVVATWSAFFFSCGLVDLRKKSLLFTTCTTSLLRGFASSGVF